MLSNTTPSKLLVATLISASCLPQFSYAKFITLENEEQHTTLIQRKAPFVLQFAATWCGACNNIKSAVEEVAQEPEFDTITIARVDVDKLPSLASHYQIKGIPAFIYFNNGNKINTIVGTQNPSNPKESLRQNIRDNLISNMPASTQAQNSTPSPSTQNTPSDNSQPHTFKDIIARITDSIMAFIHKIIQGIKNLFNR